MKTMGAYAGPALLVGSLLLTAPVHADVMDSSSHGFTVQNVTSVPGSPEKVYRSMVYRVGLWWDSNHTFGGDAAKVQIEDRAGGCFCESLPGGGSVRHMEVVYADAGNRLRMQGGLGPLQGMAVTGTMTWDYAPSGDSTRITWTYAVTGYSPDGLALLAPLVDSVLKVQLQRFERYRETGRADEP